MTNQNLYTEVSTSKAITWSVVAAVIGAGLLWLAGEWKPLTDNPGLAAVFREFGALVIAIGTISTLWELKMKRRLLSEMFAIANISNSSKVAGLRDIRIVEDFQSEIEWSNYFKGAHKVDLFFSYARSWRNSNNANLQALAKNKDAQVRLFLPDPDNLDVMSELARRFSKTPDDVSKMVVETRDKFIDLFKKEQGILKADFSLWYIADSPMHSFYRFDNFAILALHAHSSELVPIPVIEVEEGGAFFTFIKKETEDLEKDHKFKAKLNFSSR